MKTLKLLIRIEAVLLALLGWLEAFANRNLGESGAARAPQDDLALSFLGMGMLVFAVLLFVVSDLMLVGNRRKLARWLVGGNAVLSLSAFVHGSGEPLDWILLAVPAGMAVALAWASAVPLKPEEAAAELAEARIPDEARQALLRQIGEVATQEERNRLARDLHDSIKQQLFTINVGAATTQERWERDPEGAQEALADVRRSAREAMVEMQAMLHQLRPQALTSTTGLVEALREQAEALGYRSGAQVTVELGPEIPDDRMPPGAQETLFRIVQEALANVARHARARAVRIWIGVEAEHAALRVEDDGQGFDPKAEMSGMGLRNMRERAVSFGGTFQVAGAPGEGTALAVHLPLLPPPGLTPAEDPFRRQLRVYASVLWFSVVLSLFSLLAPFDISIGRHSQSLEFGIRLYLRSFRGIMDHLTVCMFFGLAILLFLIVHEVSKERLKASTRQPTALMAWESVSTAAALSSALLAILTSLKLEEPLLSVLVVSAFLGSAVVIGWGIRSHPEMSPPEEARLRLATHRATAALLFAAATRAIWSWKSLETGPSGVWLTVGLASLGLAVLELVRFHRSSERSRTAPAWLSQLKARCINDRFLAFACVLMLIMVASVLLISVGYTLSQHLSDPDPVRIALLIAVPVVFIDLVFLRQPRVQGEVP